MARAGRLVRGMFWTGAAGWLLTALGGPSAAQRPPARLTPKLEAVAETRLLMEGINQTNFRGLERLLKQQPADVETWTFVRGQALLIAETGNLLMLRPPRRGGEDAWMERSTELREAATGLARAAGNRDYARCRTALIEVANACSRCHQTFRVPVRVQPFSEPAERTGRPVAGSGLPNR